jgi:hypothetical protein
MGLWRRINAGSEWAAGYLALVFGFVWTVWVFFIIPLVAPYISRSFSAQVFYYGSGWVQLFALPLLTWIGNKTQRLADAASAVQQELLERNTALTQDVQTMVRQNRVLAETIENLTRALARIENGNHDPQAPEG